MKNKEKRKGKFLCRLPSKSMRKGKLLFANLVKENESGRFVFNWNHNMGKQILEMERRGPNFPPTL
jgi:hypothetical protein